MNYVNAVNIFFYGLPWRKIAVSSLFMVEISRMNDKKLQPKIVYDEKTKTISVKNEGRKSMTIVDVKVTEYGSKKKPHALLAYNPFCDGNQSRDVYELKDDDDIMVHVKSEYYNLVSVTSKLLVNKNGVVKEYDNWNQIFIEY